jgi:hypothetical protein
MDYTKSLKQNVQELKSEINRIKSLQRISNMNLHILKENAYKLSIAIISGEPLEKFELENDLRIIRSDIATLEHQIKRLKSIRIDLESDVGVEYVPFGKKKLLEMKDYMIKNGIDILRKRYVIADYDKNEVDIFVESVMGYDTVRIEGGKPTFNIVFGYVNKVLKPTPFPHYVYKIKQLIFKVNKDLTLTAIPDRKISNDDMNFEIYQNADKGQSGLASNYDHTSHYLSSPIIPVNRYGINNYGIELKKSGSGNNYLIGSTYIYRPINFEENAQSGFIKNIPDYTSWVYGFNEYQGYANGRHNITLDETGRMIRYNESIWKRRSDNNYLLRYRNENEEWIDIENLGNKEGRACLGNGKIISRYVYYTSTQQIVEYKIGNYTLPDIGYSKFLGFFNGTPTITIPSGDINILDYDNYNGDENFCVIYEFMESNINTFNVKYVLYYKIGLLSSTVTILEDEGTIFPLENLSHIQNVSCQMYKDKFITYTYTVVPKLGNIYTVIGMINLSMDGIEETGHRQFIMPTEYVPPSDIQYLGLDGTRFIGIHKGTLVNKEEGD